MIESIVLHVAHRAWSYRALLGTTRGGIMLDFIDPTPHYTVLRIAEVRGL